LIGNKGDSTPEYGNFPEIYYYLNWGIIFKL
jgi:hypothetical protein